MLAPQLRRIYQLPSIVAPQTQLSGAYLAWDVPLGPVAGAFKTVRGTAEDLAAYLLDQGLLTAASETAALLTADATTGILTYEAPKNMTQAQVEGLGLGITTAAGTTHGLLLGITSVYDSQTGELVITLPPNTAPAAVLSVHLYRPVGGQEQMLAADLFPFGGTGTSSATIDLLDLTEAQLREVMTLAFTDCDADPASSPAWSHPGHQFDAIYKGKNCHFYCTRGTFDPAAPAGTTGAGPCWHYFVKLG